jgi:type I restriction enzyme S subunit
MEKYQSYKSSSVEWIGEIPNSWEETRLKYVGNLYGGLTGKSGEDFKQDDNPKNKPYIPYTNIFRNTYISKNHVDYVVLEDGENQNKVKKFDLFFLMSSETYQDLGKPCILIDDIEELYLNSFCKGFRVNRIDINPLFLNYQLLGSIHKELISIEGRGFTRINLRQDRLNETPIFLPPLQEQHHIVQFLDEKTGLIDKLISTKEHKISLLKEQRTSLINQVITKGLNPNLKMKDSGVEWIGEIPEHWSIIKGKYILKILTGNYPSEIIEDECGQYFIKVDDLNYMDDNFYLSNPKLKIQDFGMKTLEEGIILFPKRGMTIFTNKVVITKSRCFIDPNLMGVKVFDTYNKIFLFYQLTSRGLGDICDSSTIPQINNKHIYPLEFTNPPLIEQLQIVEYLDSKTKEIDDLVQLEQKKIYLLKEYRQSLISEVVTGKIKVTK